MTEITANVVAPPPPLVRRWPRILWLVFIFVCGGAVGTLNGAYWMRERMIAMLQHPEQLTDRVLPRIQADLGLSSDQARIVEEIVRRRHAVMEARRGENYSAQIAEFNAMQDEVAQLLSPEQRGRWSSLCNFVEQRYLPPRPTGPPPDELIFSRFDGNDDGTLAEEEVPPGMWRRLRMADQNHDGKVSREEYQQARQAAGVN